MNRKTDWESIAIILAAVAIVIGGLSYSNFQQERLKEKGILGKGRVVKKISILDVDKVTYEFSYDGKNYHGDREWRDSVWLGHDIFSYSYYPVIFLPDDPDENYMFFEYPMDSVSKVEELNIDIELVNASYF